MEVRYCGDFCGGLEFGRLLRYLVCSVVPCYDRVLDLRSGAVQELSELDNTIQKYRHKEQQNKASSPQQQHSTVYPQTQTYRRPRSPNVTTTFYSKSLRAPNLPSVPLFHRLWASHPCFWLWSQSHSSRFLHPFLCLSRLSGTGPSAFRLPSRCLIPFLTVGNWTLNRRTIQCLGSLITYFVCKRNVGPRIYGTVLCDEIGGTDMLAVLS